MFERSCVAFPARENLTSKRFFQRGEKRERRKRRPRFFLLNRKPVEEHPRIVRLIVYSAIIGKGKFVRVPGSNGWRRKLSVRAESRYLFPSGGEEREVNTRFLFLSLFRIF